MSEFVTVNPIGGNENFSTVSDNAGQVPVVNAGEVESFNEEVNNFLTINGHILSDANVSTGGMAPPTNPPLPDRLRVESANTNFANFVGAATDVCGVVIFEAQDGGSVVDITVIYGHPYPDNQGPDAFGRDPQPVVCISPQNTSLGTAFVRESTNEYFVVRFNIPQGTPIPQSFSYIVMYPIFGPPNVPAPP